MRNLAANRVVDALAKHLGGLPAHAVCHAAFNGLHGATVTAVEKFIYRHHAPKCSGFLASHARGCRVSPRCISL